MFAVTAKQALAGTTDAYKAVGFVITTAEYFTLTCSITQTWARLNLLIPVSHHKVYSCPNLVPLHTRLICHRTAHTPR